MMYLILLLMITSRLLFAAASESLHAHDQIVCITPTHSDKAISSWPEGRLNTLPFAGTVSVVMKRAFHDVPDSHDPDQAVPARFIRYTKAALCNFYSTIPEELRAYHEKAIRDYTTPSPELLELMHKQYTFSLFTALQEALVQLNLDQVCGQPGADNPVQQYRVDASYAGQTCSIEVGAPQSGLFIEFLPSHACNYTTNKSAIIRENQSVISHAELYWEAGDHEDIPFGGSIAIIIDHYQTKKDFSVPNTFIESTMLCLQEYLRATAPTLLKAYQTTVKRELKPSKELLDKLFTRHKFSLANALQYAAINLNINHVIESGLDTSKSNDMVKRYLVAASYAGQNYIARVGAPEAEPFIRSLPSTSMAWQEGKIYLDGEDSPYINIEEVKE